MRHRKQGRKFGRTSSHRKAMFKNMSASLINHELIKTTLPKAKELRTIVEPLVTLAKREHKLRQELDTNSNEFKAQSVALRRQAFDFLRNKAAVTKLLKSLVLVMQKELVVILEFLNVVIDSVIKRLWLSSN